MFAHGGETQVDSIETALNVLKVIDPEYTAPEDMRFVVDGRVMLAFEYLAEHGTVEVIPVIRRIARNDQKMYKAGGFRPGSAPLYAHSSMALSRVFTAIYWRSFPDIRNRAIFCANRFATLDHYDTGQMTDFYERQSLYSLVSFDFDDKIGLKYLDALCEGIMRREVILYSEPYYDNTEGWRLLYLERLLPMYHRDGWVEWMLKNVKSPDAMVGRFAEDLLAEGLKLGSVKEKKMDEQEKIPETLLIDTRMRQVILRVLKGNVIPWLNDQIPKLEEKIAIDCKLWSPEEIQNHPYGPPMWLRRSKRLLEYYSSIAKE